MTKRTEELVQSICGAADHPLAPHLRAWCRESRPFVAFLKAHLGKVRKKARLAPSGDALGDLLAELAVAALWVHDRRFAVLYEPQHTSARRGPDFQVTFRSHHSLYVEVTRLRLPLDDVPGAALKLARVLGDKIGQCLPGAANVLAVVVPPGAHGGDLVPAAVRLLDRASESLALPPETVRAFLRWRGRLSAVALCAQTEDRRIREVSLWRNPGAKHPLHPDVVRHLTQAF